MRKELLGGLDVLEPATGIHAGRIRHEEDNWDEAGLEKEIPIFVNTYKTKEMRGRGTYSIYQAPNLVQI